MLNQEKKLIQILTIREKVEIKIFMQVLYFKFSYVRIEFISDKDIICYL